MADRTINVQVTVRVPLEAAALIQAGHAGDEENDVLDALADDSFDAVVEAIEALPYEIRPVDTTRAPPPTPATAAAGPASTAWSTTSPVVLTPTSDSDLLSSVLEDFPADLADAILTVDEPAPATLAPTNLLSPPSSTGAVASFPTPVSINYGNPDHRTDVSATNSIDLPHTGRRRARPSPNVRLVRHALPANSNDSSLYDYGLDDNSYYDTFPSAATTPPAPALNRPNQNLHINVKTLTGATISVPVTGSTTALQLATAITRAEGIPQDEQCLIYNGRTFFHGSGRGRNLDDHVGSHRTVDEVRMEDGAKVDLVLAYRAGSGILSEWEDEDQAWLYGLEE